MEPIFVCEAYVVLRCRGTWFDASVNVRRRSREALMCLVFRVSIYHKKGRTNIQIQRPCVRFSQRYRDYRNDTLDSLKGVNHSTISS